MAPTPEETTPRCPVCDGHPLVLVAIRHPGMRRLTGDLLEQEYHCWVAGDLGAGERLAPALQRRRPDLAVVDADDFRRCRTDGFPACRVVVVGPEPDAGYRAEALGRGAGAYIARERVGEDLGAAMRSILGCVHDPCPPDGKETP
ncbi:MAG TPA: hypothetical protein VFJ85_13200 [Acidimicrobiales bacterium]|nr:hypothetical protein [Acidimicrobiales bacterium]